MAQKLKDDVASGLKEMDLAPPADFFAPYLGTYANDALGKVTLRLQKGKGIFDAASGRRRSPSTPARTGSCVSSSGRRSRASP